MINLVREKFGIFFEEELLEQIANIALLKRVDKGTQIMGIGQYIKNMPLLVDGVIKIMKEDREGNEFLLYFLERGDTCAMSMTCCYGEAKSEIKAIAEVDTTLLMIPVAKMEEWLTFKTWRKYVFESYNDRLSEMLDSIDALVFLNLHDRLYKYLRGKAMVINDIDLALTHQEIAYDLNTSRVVISRLLKQLENEGKIKLYRNKLKIIEL